MRAMGNAIRYVWRSRAAWVVLTAVVVGDTWYWRRSWEEGVVPRVVFGLLGPRPRKSVSFSSVRIHVDQSSRGGMYEYSLETGYPSGRLPPERLYEVSATLLTSFDGLWALCVRHQSTNIRVIDTRKQTMFASAPPGSIAIEALAWYETMPLEPDYEAEWRASLIECARAGDVKRTILWGGVLHDGVMSVLSLLWILLTGAHVSRFTLRQTREARRRRHREAGLCERCGYSLEGQHFSRCPECGAELE